MQLSCDQVICMYEDGSIGRYYNNKLLCKVLSLDTHVIKKLIMMMYMIYM